MTMGPSQVWKIENLSSLTTWWTWGLRLVTLHISRLSSSDPRANIEVILCFDHGCSIKPSRAAANSLIPQIPKSQRNACIQYPPHLKHTSLCRVQRFPNGIPSLREFVTVDTIMSRGTETRKWVIQPVMGEQQAFLASSCNLTVANLYPNTSLIGNIMIVRNPVVEACHKVKHLHLRS